MYLNLRPTLWPKTNSCAKLIYVLNICNKTSTKFAFVLVYGVAKELSAGTENGRPDAYHGAALKYFCYVVCHISLYPWAAILKMSFQFFSHSSSRGVQFS